MLTTPPGGGLRSCGKFEQEGYECVKDIEHVCEMTRVFQAIGCAIGTFRENPAHILEILKDCARGFIQTTEGGTGLFDCHTMSSTSDNSNIELGLKT